MLKFAAKKLSEVKPYRNTAIIFMLTAVTLLASCSDTSVKNANETAPETVTETETGTGMETETEATYTQISQEEAKKIMDSETGYVILDVRTEEEFAAGHIQNAVLIPDYEIGERAESELTDKSQLILVYCRSGRRSKNAASELTSLGYTNVMEFGGIIDWQYGTTTD